VAVVQLASAVDVAAVLGRELTSDETARVGAILDEASVKFRREARQQFTPGTSTVRLKVNGRRVFLPQRPVNDVHVVADPDTAAPLEYSIEDGSWLVVDRSSARFVRVTYSHGGVVPDDIRLAVAALAKRVLLIPRDAEQGKTQVSSTDGPFTDAYTIATWAQGAQVLLSPEDVRLARSYRVAVPRVWVAQP